VEVKLPEKILLRVEEKKGKFSKGGIVGRGVVTSGEEVTPPVENLFRQRKQVQRFVRKEKERKSKDVELGKGLVGRKD